MSAANEMNSKDASLDNDVMVLASRDKCTRTLRKHSPGGLKELKKKTNRENISHFSYVRV